VPLTSVRLILLAALLTAAALAGTVLLWRLSLLRPVGVLLTEALLALTAGLVVNRSQQFYPSWDALFATSDPGPARYHTSAGRLDAWLAGQTGAGATQTFPWRPSGWTGWHLATAPVVTVPAGYLAHTGWRYSAVLVIGARAWTVPPQSGPTVLVTVTTTAATTASTLAYSLPGMLGRDLRVTGHRWALVSSAADASLARQVAGLGRGRFPAVGFVGVAAPPPAHPVTVGPRPAAPGSARRPAGPSPAAAPAGSVTRQAPSARKAGLLPSGIRTAYFPGAPNKALGAALTWATGQTPLPLAASAPEPTYLPPAPPRRHHRTPKGGQHGSGQPRA
jgi:hypothetical protein